MLGGNSQSEDHRPTDGAQRTKPKAAGYEGLSREGAIYMLNHKLVLSKFTQIALARWLPESCP